jgi:hypothetical protein
MDESDEVYADDDDDDYFLPRIDHAKVMALLWNSGIVDTATLRDTDERVVIRGSDRDFYIALGETLILDGYHDSQYKGWQKITDENMRTLIGGDAARGISTDTLAQLVFGALAHFYLDDDDFNDSRCALADARQFITGKFAPPTTTTDGDGAKSDAEVEDYDEEFDDEKTRDGGKRRKNR